MVHQTSLVFWILAHTSPSHHKPETDPEHHGLFVVSEVLEPTECGFIDGTPPTRKCPPTS